jgi:hypothetical protein
MRKTKTGLEKKERFVYGMWLDQSIPRPTIIFARQILILSAGVRFFPG